MGDVADQPPVGSAVDEPLVVFGEASLRYDFGPSHPLTPRRFGPGIGLLRAAGAERLESPVAALDTDVERLHAQSYVRAVRGIDDDPWGAASAGIGPGDCPAFPGMHEASTTVVGGSLRAIDAILEGRALHAFHPGGGLHHALRARASGFCVYNDVALAVARARDAGQRVLYVDIDVHHGDGTQALFWDDPPVLTISVHETGRTLFPGTGDVSETGGPNAPGSAVNVPLLPGSGDRSWLSAIEAVVPEAAEAFRPDVLVTQHGADGYVSDPLAHLEVTTAGFARAVALLHDIAHRYTRGRWLATGGGGYDVYRAVPRSWGLVWLTQAHRAVPDRLPEEWRERWAPEARRYGVRSLPERWIDAPGTAEPEDPRLTEVNQRTLARALELYRDRRPTAEGG